MTIPAAMFVEATVDGLTQVDPSEVTKEKTDVLKELEEASVPPELIATPQDAYYFGLRVAKTMVALGQHL